MKTKTNYKKYNNKSKTLKCNYLTTLSNEKHYHSNYLKNKICKFVPLYDFNINNKKNIISSCFFKMRKGYKDMLIYIEGIKLLNILINKKLKEFTLRLFIDMSIYNDKKIMTMLNSLENIELVVYCCDRFVKNDIYHLGTFGTLVRFFPLFNFNNNDTKNVIITEIDLTIEDYNNMVLYYHYSLLKKNYSYNEINKLYIYGFGKFNNIYNNKYIVPYIDSSRIIGINKIPGHIIENFLIKMNKSHITYTTFNISNEDKLSKCDDYICYGIDEYFVNNIMIRYLLKNNFSTLFLIRYNIMEPIYNHKIKDTKYLAYIKFLTKNIYINKNINKHIEFVNNIFYKNNIIKQSYNKIETIFIKRYYDLLYKCYKLKDFTIFNKDFIEFLFLKSNIGNINKLKFINYNNNLKSKEIKSRKIDINKNDINYYNNIIINNSIKNLVF